MLENFALQPAGKVVISQAGPVRRWAENGRAPFATELQERNLPVGIGGNQRA